MKEHNSSVPGFEDFRVVVNGVEQDLNVLGLMQMEEKEYVVVTDLPALEIGPGEYGIFRLVRTGKKVGLDEIMDGDFYDLLCEAWEESVDNTDGGEDW